MAQPWEPYLELFADPKVVKIMTNIGEQAVIAAKNMEELALEVPPGPEGLQEFYSLLADKLEERAKAGEQGRTKQSTTTKRGTRERGQ